MKKITTVIAAALLLLSTSSFAGEKNNYVNEKVKTAFEKAFTNASNVTWEEKDNYYLVSFRVDDVRYRVAYDLEGKVLAESKITKFDKVPAAVIAALKTQYEGYSLGNNVEVLKSGGKTTYSFTISNDNQILRVKVDESGNYVEEARD